MIPYNFKLSYHPYRGGHNRLVLFIACTKGQEAEVEKHIYGKHPEYRWSRPGWKEIRDTDGGVTFLSYSILKKNEIIAAWNAWNVVKRLP